MDLPNLKELKAVLKLCRTMGVTDITLGGIAIKFGELPLTQEEKAADVDGVMAAVPSDEDMAYWSAAPDPLASREEASQ